MTLVSRNVMKGMNDTDKLNTSDDVNGYELLANAIILKSAEDYQKARLKLIKHPGDDKAIAEMVLIKQFFMSDFFSAITNIDPSALIEQLDKTDPGITVSRKIGMRYEKRSEWDG